MTALLQRLHARRCDFWWCQKRPCTPNGEMLSYPHAQRTRDALHDGQPNDGGGLHPFASRRKRALSDFRRVRVLTEAISNELLRASQHGESTSVRELTPYEFIGVTEQLKSLRIILCQPNIEAIARPADPQIAAHLAALGLKPEDRYFFGNDLLAVTDVGVQSDNVLLDDDGQLRFIDPLIRLKKPALAVIKELIGNFPG